MSYDHLQGHDPAAEAEVDAPKVAEPEPVVDEKPVVEAVVEKPVVEAPVVVVPPPESRQAS